MVVSRMGVVCHVGDQVIACHKSAREGGESREIPDGPFGECCYVSNGPSGAVGGCCSGSAIAFAVLRLAASATKRSGRSCHQG